MKKLEKYVTIIQQDYPDLQVFSIEKTGEGDNSLAFIINETYIFRFPKRAVVKEQVRREIAALPQIKKQITIDIPQFEFISPQLNYVGYQKISGEPFAKKLLLSLNEKEQENILKSLADFLSSIHSMKLSELIDANLETPDLKVEYRDNFEKAQELIYPFLTKNKRKLLSLFFNDYLNNEKNFDYAGTLVQNDFSKDHILFDTEKKSISGIIDFGDIAISDPDYDLMYLLDEFGEVFLQELLKYYQPINKPVPINKIRFFTLANKIQTILQSLKSENKEDEKSAYNALNHWLKNYESIPHP